MPRKPILDQKIINIAGQLLRDGNYVTTICDYLGIDQATWYNWLERGREVVEAETDEEAEKIPNYQLYFDFFKMVKASEAEAEMKMVSRIKSASFKSWQAAAWYLERKHRDRWGRVMQEGAGNAKALDNFLNGLKAMATNTEEESGDE